VRVLVISRVPPDVVELPDRPDRLATAFRAPAPSTGSSTVGARRLAALVCHEGIKQIGVRAWSSSTARAHRCRQTAHDTS
jgi:hypothetical protein